MDQDRQQEVMGSSGDHRESHVCILFMEKLSRALLVMYLANCSPMTSACTCIQSPFMTKVKVLPLTERKLSYTQSKHCPKRVEIVNFGRGFSIKLFLTAIMYLNSVT